MRRIQIFSLVGLLLALSVYALVYRNAEPSPRLGLVLKGGRHLALPLLDSAAPGAESIQQRLQLSDLRRAERAARRAAQEHPSSPGALYNLGVVLQWQNRPAEAIRFYRRALESAPGYVRAAEAINVAEQQLQMSRRSSVRSDCSQGESDSTPAVCIALDTLARGGCLSARVVQVTRQGPSSCAIAMPSDSDAL